MRYLSDNVTEKIYMTVLSGSVRRPVLSGSVRRLVLSGSENDIFAFWKSKNIFGRIYICRIRVRTID